MNIKKKKFLKLINIFSALALILNMSMIGVFFGGKNVAADGCEPNKHFVNDVCECINDIDNNGICDEDEVDTCIDNDDDGYGVGEGCLDTDCNDNNPSSWRVGTYYYDGDSDGYYGDGSNRFPDGTMAVCCGVGIPAGYTDVTTGKDCNDNDETKTTVCKNDPVCEVGNPISVDGGLATLNIGDTTSEAGFILSGWSSVWDWGGNYGGGSDDGSLRLLMGPGDGCGDTYKAATVSFNTGANYLNSIKVNHLDGTVDDSFEIYINNVYAGNYTAGQNSGEVWVTSTFEFPQVNGDVTVKFVAIQPDNSWCADWGQVAFSMIEFNGYSCEVEEIICGDAVCDATESCETCSADCGQCKEECVPGTELLDEVLPESLSTWTVYNTGGNPIFNYSEIISPYDTSTAIQTSVIGDTYSLCPSQYIEKIYEVDGNSLDSDLKAYLAFTSTMDYYNFPYIVLYLLDENDVTLGSQVYYGKGVISGIYAGYAASDPAHYTELPEASGNMTLNLSTMGDVNFSKIKIMIANYACIGENSVTFDHLRLITDCGETPIYGCTNSEANNYDPEATHDDESCEFSNNNGTETYCGDGLVQTPNDREFNEECDGSAPSGYSCNSDCTLKENSRSSSGGGNPGYDGGGAFFLTTSEGGSGATPEKPTVLGEEGAPVLTITKKANKNTVNPGEKFEFEIVIKNIGNLTAFGVVVTDILPDGFEYEDGNGTVSLLEGLKTIMSTKKALADDDLILKEKTWNIGDLPAGESKTISIGVKAKDGIAKGIYSSPTSVVATNHSQVSSSVDVNVEIVKVLAATGFSNGELISLIFLTLSMLGGGQLLRRKIRA